MAVDSHFGHSCQITRPLPDGQDGYRQVRGKPDVVAECVCRLVEKTRSAVSTETKELVTVAGYRLLLPWDADVRAGDTVEWVRREDGSQAGPFFVKALLTRRSRAAQFLSADLTEAT